MGIKQLNDLLAQLRWYRQQNTPISQDSEQHPCEGAHRSSYLFIMVPTSWAVIALVTLVTVVDQSLPVAALSCMPCEYNVTCPCLPDYCQKGLRPCGCCYECKGKVGHKCSGLLVPYVSCCVGRTTGSEGFDCDM